MLWMGSEKNVKENREYLQELKKVGYRFKINASGYQVWFKGEYLHGAGTAQVSKHWRHREADSKMYLFQAVLTAHKHKGDLK